MPEALCHCILFSTAHYLNRPTPPHPTQLYFRAPFSIASYQNCISPFLILLHAQSVRLSFCLLRYCLFVFFSFFLRVPVGHFNFPLRPERQNARLDCCRLCLSTRTLTHWTLGSCQGGRQSAARKPELRHHSVKIKARRHQRRPAGVSQQRWAPGAQYQSGRDKTRTSA